MSYIDSNAVFAGGIQELSFDEIEQVDGGLLPVLLLGVAIALLWSTPAY